jgi:hypothetical protein
MIMAANADSHLWRRTPHIPPMPGFGRTSIDRAGERDGRHLTADYQQAADLALDAADPRRAGRDNDRARSIWLGGELH